MLKVVLRSAVVLFLALATAWPGSLQAAADDDEQLKVLLVMDASGSMKDADPSGMSKIDAAKAALISSLDDIPADAHVGLRVYGATVDGPGRTPEECTDSQLVHPITALDRTSLTTAINSFQALGETPIAHSLLEAAKDLGSEGKRHIILVSDGEERCVPDPCEAIKQIADAGIGLQIDTVGFDVNDKARKQLQCIAQVGGGNYTDAIDGEGLNRSLTFLTKRSARTFEVQGEPVVGTPDEKDAPGLGPGQYTDVSESSKQGDVSKHYRIRRDIPGSTLRVSVVARMAPWRGGVDRGEWRAYLRTSAGDECAEHMDMGSDVVGFGTVVSLTALALPLDPRVSDPAEKHRACAEADELVFQLRRPSGRHSGDVTPFELRVIEEPPATNTAQLPPGIEDVPGHRSRAESPADGEPLDVVGGISFNDALEMAPGTYVTEIVSGERVFFRSPIDWGQSAVFAIDGIPDSFAPGPRSGLAIIKVDADVYAPDFSEMTTRHGWSDYRWDDGFYTHDPAINFVPEVRYRNRWESPRMSLRRSLGFSMAGDYYFSISVGDVPKDLVGVPIPVLFSLAVNGEVQGVPEFASPSPSPEPSPDSGSGAPSETPTDASSPPTGADTSGSDRDADSDGVPMALIIGGAAAAVVALVAGAYALGRRKG